MLDAWSNHFSSAGTKVPDKAAIGLKSELQQVIGEASKEEAAHLLDRLWAKEGLTVQVAPHLTMVMYNVADPFDCAFYLGEVLITQARVECETSAGCGQILGDEPEKALLLATVEAMAAASCVGDLEPLIEFIDRLKLRRMEHLRHEGQLTAATAVQFESMQKERVDFGSLG
jgi:phosphonate C-P lyase system protein PhnG